MNIRYKILRYGLLKRFKRGIRVHAILTFACNFENDCYYCTWKAGGGWPKSKVMRLSEWKKVIRRFPLKIREFVVTGGEPMLHPDFNAIVKWMLDQGYFVTVYTNLSRSVGIDLPGHHRLRFYASRHSMVRKVPFLVSEYSRFRVDENDIGSDKGLLRCYECQGKRRSECHDFSKAMIGQGANDCNRVFICPDGEVMINYLEIARRYSHA